MEDPSKEEWEVQDYSTIDERNEKFGWIWRTGLNLGKKIMVVGVVITSAPLVLPPLVVLSTVGFAFSVPVGFAFVTYACTEKAVNTTALIVEGKEFREDRRKEIGTKDELGNGNDQANNYGVISINKDELDAGTKVNEIAEDNVYEEDIIEYMEHKEETLSSDAMPDTLEGIREAEDEISLRKRESNELSVESLQAVVVAANIGGQQENKVLDEIAYLAPSYTKEENRRKSKSADIDEKEARKDTAGPIEEIIDDSEYDPIRHDRRVQQAREGSEGSIASDMSQNKGNRNFVVIPEDAKSAHNGKEVTHGSTSAAKSSALGNAGTQKKVSKKKSKRDKSRSIQEEPKLLAEERLEVHVRTCGGQTTIDIQQGTSSDRKRGNLNPSKSDETGSHLVDHGTMVPEQILNFAMKTPKWEQLSSKNMGVNVGHHRASVESRKPMAKEPKSGSDWDTTSIGYKAARNSSCVEELKALYAFTGIEPPASSSASGDPVTINEKVHFLMSVIGGKQSSG
ncbi:hypothetical protein Cgig2_022799 [Carnegiea gigantea]|uniref:Uncharacterized protein n=1 Tax=Carnegiea gigantea TaxID=171969 RepID=A0A9Q1KQ63_9CARY|nr:hypothetical protein Cgig2_022799 [Carnegiea gigantea]